MNHTPTPYEIYSSLVGPLIIKSGDTEVAYVGADSFALCQANAEFISRACNMHKKLVQELMDIHPNIESQFMRERIGKLIIQARGGDNV